MKKNAVIFARANGGHAAIQQQVHVLTEYAVENNIKVVASVTLPHCSADDYKVKEHLTALLGKRRGLPDFRMIVVTDLSRLSRRGVPDAMNIIKRLAIAGISVVTPDLGVVNEKLWSSFPKLNRGWAKRRKSFKEIFTNKKEIDRDASNNRQAACNEEAEAVTRPDQGQCAAAVGKRTKGI